MAIKNSTFADVTKAELDVLTNAHGLQFKAETAIAKAEKGWQDVVNVLSERGIKIEYLKSPNGDLGPIDGYHIDVNNFVREHMLLPIHCTDPQGLLEFCRNDDFNGKAERAFTVLVNNKMKEVTRTKKTWQAFVRDLPKNLYAKVKRASDAEKRGPTAKSDQFTLLAKKIEAAIAHCKKLNPEKDESIADLDIVSILLGLETAKDHLIQK